MENKTKKFHFQELNWVLCFPNAGNEGRKYLYYTVNFFDLNLKTQRQTALVDIIDRAEFENGYPHTVGFFRAPFCAEDDFMPNYLELRVISCIEELWKFLNDLNI